MLRCQYSVILVVPFVGLRRVIWISVGFSFQRFLSLTFLPWSHRWGRTATIWALFLPTSTDRTALEPPCSNWVSHRFWLTANYLSTRWKSVTQNCHFSPVKRFMCAGGENLPGFNTFLCFCLLAMKVNTAGVFMGVFCVIIKVSLHLLCNKLNNWALQAYFCKVYVSLLWKF